MSDPIINVTEGASIALWSPWEGGRRMWCTFDHGSFHTAHSSLTDAMRQVFTQWSTERLGA